MAYTTEQLENFIALRAKIIVLKEYLADSEYTVASRCWADIQSLCTNLDERKALYVRMRDKFDWFKRETDDIRYSTCREYNDYFYPTVMLAYIEDEYSNIPLHIADNDYYYCSYRGQWFTSEEAMVEDAEDEDAEDGDIYDYAHDVLEELSFTRAKGEKPNIKLRKEIAMDWFWDQEDGESRQYYNSYMAEVDTTLYLGVELEVLVRDPELGASRYAYNNLNGFVICKRDASVCDNDRDGFEIVSAPATLKVHQERWDKFFEHDAKHLKGWYARNCGMHVHLSRDAFSSNAHLSKFVCFINLDRNTDFTVKVAGRDSENYAAIHHKKPAASDTYGENSDRYQAVNLSNEKTVEVRIFRSNTARLGFLKNIEFCHAVFAYTKQCSWVIDTCGNNSLYYADFIEWMKKPAQYKSYPALYKWLQRENFIATKVVKEVYKLPQHEVLEMADAA